MCLGEPRGRLLDSDLAANLTRSWGGDAAQPSSLMFAKFSPDGERVAYVRENNLYVEDLPSGRSPG